MPLSVAWPLPRAKSSAESKHFRDYFIIHFSTDQDEIWCGDEAVQHLDAAFEWNISNRKKWRPFYWPCQKMLALTYIQTFMNQFGSNFVWWEMLLNSTFWLKVTGKWERKMSMLVISQTFNGIYREFDVLLRLAGLMDLLLIFSWLIKGKIPT